MHKQSDLKKNGSTMFINLVILISIVIAVVISKQNKISTIRKIDNKININPKDKSIDTGTLSILENNNKTNTDSAINNNNENDNNDDDTSLNHINFLKHDNNQGNLFYNIYKQIPRELDDLITMADRSTKTN